MQSFLGGLTVKAVLVVTVDQQKVDIGEKLRVFLSNESRLSVYDTSQGKLDRLLNNADAIILLCSETLESLLNSRKNVTLKMEDVEVQIDCGILHDYIQNESKRQKFIMFTCDTNHIPAKLRGNFSYICSDEKKIDEGEFLSTVRPQIESL